MKFSLTFLKDHLETTADAVEVAAKLNAIGLEVEGVEDPAAALAGFRVARVVTAEPHPNADKLRVLTVDAGDEVLQVVCGAPNARAGLIGVLGLPGAVVPNGGFALKVSAIRGVESHGMMCSARELGLGEGHDGIIELPGDAPVGQAFADYHGSDPVFDVSITPNRPDCMGVYGIARDLAAAGLGALKPIPVASEPGAFACPVEIRTDDPEGCPAFYGRVIRGVRNGASPDWMQARLTSAGQRPISALVDITNYVMLAYGRPAHAYDLAKLRGAVVARRARGGEVCQALNGKTYPLDDSMTVIADDAGVHDIAGIMGGEDSGCSDATTDVLLEIAYFTPERIGATGRKLNLTSDARARFERGVDPAFLDAGLDILTALIVEICGGQVSEVVRAGAPPLKSKEIEFYTVSTKNLAGLSLVLDDQSTILTNLGFANTPGPSGSLEVIVPPWRPDIAGAPDIVEEVVRIHGLDKVASVALPRADGVARPTATAEQRLERRLRRAGAARGLNEAITWSFLPEADAAHFTSGNGGLWTLANPISEDMKAMRPSLLPGLLAAARRNMDRGAAAVRLFEIGRRYLRGDAQASGGRSDERLTLGVVLAGEKRARGWADGKAVAFDAYDAKAEALALLAEAGAPVDNLQIMGEAGEQFHPGQSATLRLGPKTVLARFGMLHPATLKAFGIDAPVVAAEVFLDALPARKGAAGFARPEYAPPALQAVTRDFAFVIDEQVAVGDLLRSVRTADKVNIVAAGVFDVFNGGDVPAGRKSVAITVMLQPTAKSYSESELGEISQRIIDASRKHGANIRHEIEVPIRAQTTTSTNQGMQRDVTVSASVDSDVSPPLK